MIKAGIVGGAGYTGGEVFRLLLNHPDVEIAFVQSESKCSEKVYLTHLDCFGYTELIFQNEMEDADVLFLCKGHGESIKVLENNYISDNTKVIDLSQDFRHKSKSNFKNRIFVYGLPELNKETIASTNNIANPGCFATAIQLGLLPLATEQLLSGDIHITAVTGSTGAGQSLSPTNHFSWRSNNHSAYKTFQHQHEVEIIESLSSLQKSNIGELYFSPQRGAFTRGIYMTAIIKGDFNLNEMDELYKNYYRNHPFTKVVPFEPDVKQVINTNHCFVHLQVQKNSLIITSVIDNLLKGAAGQAIQNMNLMFGLNETSGLNLKASVF